jgi:hypothetical protein
MDYLSEGCGSREARPASRRVPHLPTVVALPGARAAASKDTASSRTAGQPAGQNERSSAKLVSEREDPAEDAESRPLAPAVLPTPAPDRTASILGVAEERSSDIEHSDKQQTTPDHAAHVSAAGTVGNARRAIASRQKRERRAYGPGYRVGRKRRHPASHGSDSRFPAAASREGVGSRSRPLKSARAPVLLS